MSLTELTSLISPPQTPRNVPESIDWSTIEAKLGLKLPLDYKRYIETYGSGLLAEFIRVLNPFDRDKYINLLKCSQSITSMFRTFPRGEHSDKIPYPFYPDHSGLLPWGNDENGIYIFWLTEGAPTKWPTVVADIRGPRWQRFDLPMTRFLTKIITKEVRCRLWPKDFPGKKDTLVFNSRYQHR